MAAEDDFLRRYQAHLDSPRGQRRRQAFFTGRRADRTHPYDIAERLRDLADAIERYCVDRASQHHRHSN